MTTTPTQSATNSNANATKDINFGNGRYSALMTEIFKNVQTVFKIEPAHAEKVARQVGSDFGAATQNAVVSASLGKVNKDGKLTLAEASKVKGVTLTNSLFIMYALQWVANAGGFGISYGFTTWTPTAALQKALDGFNPVKPDEAAKLE